MNQRWTIGAVEVETVVEVALPIPGTGLFPNLTPELLAAHESWLRPSYVNEDGTITIAIQSYLVRSAGLRIVVDTCFGNDHPLPYDGLPPLQTDFLDRLTAADFAPEAVDVVLCTHLHIDHVGWNTRLVDGMWAPTFPNARYLFGAAEVEHWQHHEDPNIDLADTVTPILASGLCERVASDHRVTDEVRLVPTPGHTPGHVSVRIESRGEVALISGDTFHHPIQVGEPGLWSGPDFDKDLACATRARLAAELAADDVLLLGTHFAEPSGGRVRPGPEGGWAFHGEAPT